MRANPDYFARGAFHWCIDHVDLGDPVVSRLVRVVCRDQHIWPEQLLGHSGAGGAACLPGHAPIATGPSPAPRIESRFALARRLLWRASYELTEWSVENIAYMLGGYSPATVRPWAVSWRQFERTYDRWETFHDGSRFNWWRRFGPHHIDLLGLPMPETYLEWLDEPSRGLIAPGDAVEEAEAILAGAANSHTLPDQQAV